MDFTLSAKTIEYAAKLQTFMDAEIFPAESVNAIKAGIKYGKTLAH